MEELKEFESTQEWLEKRIQEDIKDYRVRAQNHLEFLEGNPTFDDFVARKKEIEALSGKQGKILPHQEIIYNYDIFNYVQGLRWAWMVIKKKGERGREEVDLGGRLPDDFYKEVERELVPLDRELKENINPDRKSFPKFKKISRQWAERLIEFTNKEEEIYRSLPEETLREIREQKG